MRAMMTMLAMLAAVPLLAQDSYEATYIVQREGREVGRERVVLRAIPGTDKSRLELESRYAGAPETMRAVLSREGAVFESLQLELRRQDGSEAIRVTNQGNRVFITSTAKGTRGGRELPGGPGVVMVEERLLGLLLAVPAMVPDDGAQLVAVSPRTGKRTPFSARRVEGGVELTGELSGRIVLDKSGQVEKVTLANGTSMARLPS